LFPCFVIKTLLLNDADYCVLEYCDEHCILILKCGVSAAVPDYGGGEMKAVG